MLCRDRLCHVGTGYVLWAYVVWCGHRFVLWAADHISHTDGAFTLSLFSLQSDTGCTDYTKHTTPKVAREEGMKEGRNMKRRENRKRGKKEKARKEEPNKQATLIQLDRN